MRKSAQVTLFIIIGILILAVVAGLTYMVVKQKKTVTDIGIGKMTATSEEQKKIQNYVQECLDTSSIEGIEILRAQGGYINFPEGIETLETDSDVIIFENNGKHIKKGVGKVKVPYYLMGDEMRIPTIDFMQRELENYITEQVDYCIDDFKAFEGEGIGISSGLIDVTVYLDDAYVVKLDYPIEGVYNGKNFYLREFSTTAPINIPRIQNYVIDLVYYEMQDKYLEKHANQILTMYKYNGGKKKEFDLPPKIFVNTNLDCQFETWTLPEVEEDVKNLFTSYYPLVKFANTNIESDDIDSSDVFYDAFVKNYFPTDNDMKINLTFNPENPFVFNVRTPMGSLKPFRVTQTEIPFLPQICVFKYVSKYDIDMPILFTLEDGKSPKINTPDRISKDKGFVWRFYMDALIYGNQNREEKNIMSKYDGVAEDFAKANNISLTDLGFGRNSEYYNISDKKKTMFVLKDPKTKKPLSGVDVEYSCGGSSSNKKFLGRTNDDGEISVDVETCNNGTVGNVTLNKLGYTPKTVGLNYFFQMLNETDMNATNMNMTNMTNSSLEKEYIFDFTMEKEKEYIIKFKGLHLPTFVDNYYLTYGFREDACDGRTKEQLLEESYYDLYRNDEVIYSFKNKEVKKLINPMMYYPTMDNTSISRGFYDVSISYRGDVVIKPGTYVDENGNTKTVDLNTNPLTTRNYEGSYDLGKVEYEYYFSPLESTKEILLIAPANFNIKDDMDVFSMGGGILQEDGSIKKTVLQDRNCNNVNEEVDVIISKDNFYEYIKPSLS